MNLEEHLVECPYCGEAFTALVEPSEHEAEYIEDCEVCCQPIVFCV
ncbi:MAG: CPXCG motif-containing cysteine-rich protein, partial [Arenicellales bacterium]|nr:CPXCG motif-containing cysteine-rich protein [Arenicellales bacterium]